MLGGTFLWAHAAGTHHPSQFYFILFPCFRCGRIKWWKMTNFFASFIAMKFLNALGPDEPFAAPFRVSPKTETNSIRSRKNRITTWWLVIVCYSYIVMVLIVIPYCSIPFRWIQQAGTDVREMICRLVRQGGVVGTMGFKPKKLGTPTINGHSRILNWRYLPYIRPI